MNISAIHYCRADFFLTIYISPRTKRVHKSFLAQIYESNVVSKFETFAQKYANLHSRGVSKGRVFHSRCGCWD